jgi:hypothetical protein
VQITARKDGEGKKEEWRRSRLREFRPSSIARLTREAMRMPDPSGRQRQISQTPYPIRFAAKSAFLAAYKPRPHDAEMQHNRPTDVERRQHTQFN